MPEVMVPLTASVVEFRKQALIVRQVAEEVFRERQITVPFLLGTMIELPRAAAHRRRARPRGAVLLLRHQRPHPDHLGPLPRRRRALPALLPRARRHRGRSLPGARPGRRRQADPDGLRAGPPHPSRPQARHLRRARRRAGAVAFCDRLGMNYVSCSPVPGADRPAGRGPGGAGRAGHDGPHRAATGLARVSRRHPGESSSEHRVTSPPGLKPAKHRA